MKAVAASSAALVAATGAYAAGQSLGLIGDSVPVIYAKTAYPHTVYNGTQYNATVISGVPLNASNEWPCITADKYESIIPKCALYCIDAALATDECDRDDFSCHCTERNSNMLDASVVPCLTASPHGTCSHEELDMLVNFIHGSLCPYFIGVPKEIAYGHCDRTSGPSKTSSTCDETKTRGPSSTLSCDGDDEEWHNTWTKTTSSKWGKPTETTWTVTKSSWTKVCDGPTTFWHGTKTWAISSATTLTVTDWPIVETSTSTWYPVGTGEPAPVGTGSWTTVAAQPIPTKTAGDVPVMTGAAAANRVAGGVAVAVAGVAAILL